MGLVGSFHPRGDPSHPVDDSRIVIALRYGRLTAVAERPLFCTSLSRSGDRALACVERRSIKTRSGSKHLLATWADGPKTLASEPGDFALAFIDDVDARLTLVLAPLSELQLFYVTHDDGSIAFATDLRDLLRARPQSLDLEALSQLYHVPIFQRESVIPFRNVRQLAAGTTIQFDRSGATERRFWDAPLPNRESVSLDEAAHQLRSALDESICDRIAALPGATGTQLSAGRDSSAITALCAMQLREKGETVDAWTAAALPGEIRKGTFLYDEAPIARRMADRFDNVRHHILRPQPFDLCSRLDQLHRTIAQPLFQPSALAWCEPLWSAAEAQGNRLLLCGDFGNYALSAGGPLFMQDVRTEEGTFRWMGQTGLHLTRHPGAARHLLAQLRRRTTMPSNWHSQPLGAFVTGDFGAAWRLSEPSREVDLRTYRTWLREGIGPHLHPKNVIRVGRTLECSDPSRDRRVVEAIHSLPSRLLFSARDRRRVYERAFADVLPAEVVRNDASGVQNADWFLSISPEALKCGLHRYRSSPQVRAFLDTDAISKALQRWPGQRCVGGDTYRLCIFGILPALSLASFLWVQDTPN